MPSKKKLRKTISGYQTTLHWYEHTFEEYEQRSYEQRAARIRAENSLDKAGAELVKVNNALSELRAAAWHLISFEWPEPLLPPGYFDRFNAVRELLEAA